jgi:hypothetical protein
VLDHDHGVAEVPQVDQRLDQAPVVALVEPDRGLVQDVEHAHQLRADLRREPDPLRLSAGERVRGAVERQVVQADVDHELEALADLLQDAARDRLLALRQRQLIEERDGRGDRERARGGDALVRDRDGERLRLQPRAPAGRARPLGHELVQLGLDVLRLRLVVPALDVREHALERRPVGAAHAVLVAVAEPDLALARAGEEELELLLRQLAHRRVHVDRGVLADGLQHLRIEELGLDPGRDRPLRQGQLGVRDDEVGIDDELRAQARAGRTGAVWRVEREVPRLRLWHADAVVRARVVLAHRDLLAAVGGDDQDGALAQLGRDLQGVDEPRPLLGADDDPVHDDLDVVLLVALERDLLAQLVRRAVHADAREPLLADVLQQPLVLALAAAHDGAQDQQSRARGHALDLVGHLLDRLLLDLASADRAVRPADPGVEEAEVVVHLRDRADGRARVPRRALLVDGDRGREAFDHVHVRLLHLAQELPGVGGERLDVAALALGVDRVERERRLARAGQAREDDELVARQRQRDVLQVVLSGTSDRDAVGGHGSSYPWPE